MSSVLRTSLIWHDEVMADVVHEKRVPVTIGTDSAATFVTPELALPPSFAIVTPGLRGYVLTLSAGMSGTISIGGVEQDVASFVAMGDGSGFRGAQLGPEDWGVITLGASGEHKFFFQFVPHEVEDWNLGHPMILAGVGGYALSVIALTLFWWRDAAFSEALFRGATVASLAIGLAAIVRWAFKQNSESRASLAFSVLLHSAILLLTFQLYEKESPAVWPGPKSMTGTYLVKASEQEAPKPEPVVATRPTVTPVSPGVAMPVRPSVSPELPGPAKPWKRAAKPTLPAKAHDKGDGGDKGGPKVGLLQHDDLIGGVIGDRGLAQLVDDVDGMGGGNGNGGPEIGKGNGNGLTDTKNNGGTGKDPRGKHEKSGDMDTGGNRDAKVCVGNCEGGGAPPMRLEPHGTGGGGDDTLSKDDIAKVMGSRQGLFRACYQVALDRGGSRGGDLVVRFVIDSNGKVTSASTVSGSIDGSVASCVKQKLFLLRFPKKPAGAVVSSFPFVFSSN